MNYSDKYNEIIIIQHFLGYTKNNFLTYMNLVRAQKKFDSLECVF
jgi:hypothetical protein